MSIKLVDSLSPMGSFPVAEAKDIVFDDSESLQKKYDNGELSGEGSGHLELTQSEYDALSEEEKLNGVTYFITDAIGGGGDASIDDNNISTETTWSSTKIFTEMSDNYAIFEGIIGSSYYSTTIDDEDITNAPVTDLYGGWTLDKVTTNLTEGSVFSAYNNATNKKIISFTEGVSVGEVYNDSFSVIDDTMNNGGKPYKVALLWSDNAINEPCFLSVGLDINSNTGKHYVIRSSGSFEKVKYAYENNQICILNVRFNADAGTTNHYITPLYRTDSEVKFLFTGFSDHPDMEITLKDPKSWSVKEIEQDVKIYTSLEQLGLTAPTTVGEVFVAMPDESMLMLNVENVADANVTITDAPHNYGLLTIEKHSNSRFRIEFSNSLGGNASDARKWIASIKGNDGTGLRWIELTGSSKIYTTMAQLGLDGSTATVQDVMDAISVGEIAMLRSDAFNNNNWQTQCNGIQWGYLKIEKTMNNLSNIELQEVVSPSRRYFGTQSSGKFVGWVQMNTEEILHTSLSGNLAGITTVLDLVNALLTEYRALSSKKPVRFISGEITKTTLTDFPVTYGVLQITVAGWDVVEVRLAHSANGFKSMYYGFLTRITGQESISSIAWEKVATTKVADVARTALTFNESVKATTSNALSQANSYIVRNGICYVTLDITTNSVATDVNTTVNIADGLPTPAQHTSSTAAPFGKTSTTGVVYISTTGNLCGRSLISNSRYVLSFSYPVAD